MELINHKNAKTYAITQRTSSKVTLILVLYDFIVQSILSSLLLLCYNLMIMNDYWLWINYKYSFYPSFIIWNTTKTEM